MSDRPRASQVWCGMKHGTGKGIYHAGTSIQPRLTLSVGTRLYTPFYRCAAACPPALRLLHDCCCPSLCFRPSPALPLPTAHDTSSHFCSSRTSRTSRTRARSSSLTQHILWLSLSPPVNARPLSQRVWPGSSLLCSGLPLLKVHFSGLPLVKAFCSRLPLFKAACSQGYLCSRLLRLPL